MNYNEKKDLRMQNEEVYQIVGNLEYFHNELKDWITRILNVSIKSNNVLFVEDLYNKVIEEIYPEMEDYEKKFLLKEVKEYDELVSQLWKHGFEYSLETNSNGYVEVNVEEKEDGDDFPSSCNGDYSPSDPWNAPGMCTQDFIK